MARLTEAGGGLQRRRPAPPLPALIMMTDRRRQGDPQAAIARLPPGAAVILRDYDAPDRPALARRLARLCRARRLVFLVAGDWRLALAVAAQGLHLPEGLARHGRRHWRQARRRRFLVTQAAHSAAALALARRLGADAAILSPVFATRSHPDARPLGVVRFARLVRTAGCPVYALGGIDPVAGRRLGGSGLAGVVAIGGISALAPQSPRPLRQGG